MTVEGPPCSLILGAHTVHGEADLPELRRTLENGSDTARIDAMKTALRTLSSGNTALASALLMTIIRFVMPNQRNKMLKKLVLLFFELAPKVDAEGRLLSEMILLCNALRNDLQHPNEYVRGTTLRFLTRIREAEILEPLLPSVRQCLEHKHPYVRRNAITALHSIYLTNDFLQSDAPEVLQNVLATETDAGCLRNAFVALSHTDPERAGEYLASVVGLAALDPLLQLAIIEFIRADSARNEENVARNVKSIVVLLQSAASSVVKFEAATALMLLSSAPVAIKAVANCYIELAVRETDNNAKLMVLGRFRDLQAAHASIINESVLDVTRILAANDLTVRRQALDILSAGITQRHAADLIAFLVKEIAKLGEYDRANEYKQCLIVFIDSCATRFPAVAPAALSCYVELIKDGNPAIIVNDAIRYAKELLERVPALRIRAVGELLDALSSVTDAKATASLLWIVGEFATTPEAISLSFRSIKEAIGPLPIVDTEAAARTEQQAQQEREGDQQPKTKISAAAAATRRLNADGTYATETALTANAKSSVADGPALRQLILKGEYLVGVALASGLVKMCLHSDAGKGSALGAQAMLFLTSILRVGLSPIPSAPIDRDSYDRIMLALRVLAKPSPALEAAFATECRLAFDAHLRSLDSVKRREHGFGQTTRVDDHVKFRLAAMRKDGRTISIAPDEWLKDMELALGVGSNSSSDSKKIVSVLSKVVQLTGFSDEIYAETYVTVSHSDIILDILLVNQTDETLQNVSIDLSCSGDLKVNEKPALLTLAPQGFAVTKAAIKVRSTDNGLVFGSLSYGVTDVTTIVLSSIHIDICEYIRAGSSSDADFRSMWTTLEWENKINVPLIPGSQLGQVMEAILQGSHLQCLTPAYGISETGDYLAANMYAVTLFGEEILANICLERSTEGVTGHLRLRSKTQGIAIALGDRITEIVTKMSRVVTEF